MRDGRTKTRQSRGRQGSSGYVLTWATLAAFGLGYLGVAAANPNLLATVLPMSDRTASLDANRNSLTSRALTDFSVELATMRQRMTDIGRDVAGIKVDVARQAEQADALERRLAAAGVHLPAGPQVSAETPAEAAGSIAARFAAATDQPTTPSAPAKTGANGRTETKDAPKRVAAKPAPPAAATPRQPPGPLRETDANFERTITAAIEPGGTAPKVRIINGGAASQITTGSLPNRNPPQPAPTQQTARPVGPLQAVEIARAESLDTLRNRWSELSTRNPALRRLAPRYRITADGSGGPFKLIAGPFGDSKDATRTCAQLKAKGVPCSIGDFTGNAL